MISLQVLTYCVKSIVLPGRRSGIHKVIDLRCLRRQSLIVHFVQGQSQPYLPHIAQTVDLLSFSFCSGKGRQQHRSQNRNDGNDNQQLNQGERSCLATLSCCHISQTRLVARFHQECLVKDYSTGVDSLLQTNLSFVNRFRHCSLLRVPGFLRASIASCFAICA